MFALLWLPQEPIPLPNGPSVGVSAPPPQQKPLALNASFTRKYDATKGTSDMAPALMLDYRFWRAYRVGLSVSYSIVSQDLSVSGSFNVKLLSWGKPKPSF